MAGDSSLRGFVIVFNRDVKGYLLLQCDEKLKKGLHYQLPGGRFDRYEDRRRLAAAREENLLQSSGEEDRCKHAEEHDEEDALCRIAAIRELFEETGVDLRHCPQRLVSLSAESRAKTNWASVPALQGPLKNRRFYYVAISSESGDGGGCGSPQLDARRPRSASGGGDRMTAPQQCGIAIRLSEEHSGYVYVSDLESAAQMVERHSGGYCSAALRQLCLSPLFEDVHTTAIQLSSLPGYQEKTTKTP